MQALKLKYCCCTPSEERTPILSQQILVPELQTRKPRPPERDSFSVEFTASKEQSLNQNEMIKAEIGKTIKNIALLLQF